MCFNYELGWNSKTLRNVDTCRKSGGNLAVNIKKEKAKFDVVVTACFTSPTRLCFSSWNRAQYYHWRLYHKIGALHESYRSHSPWQHSLFWAFQNTHKFLNNQILAIEWENSVESCWLYPPPSNDIAILETFYYRHCINSVPTPLHCQHWLKSIL